MPRVNPVPPIFVGPCFRIKLFGIVKAQQTVSTFYLIPAAASTVTPTPTAILTAFTAQIDDAWDDCLAGAWLGDINTCDRFDDPTIAQIKAISLLAGSQIVTDVTPTLVTMKMRKLTALGGQRGRGVLRMPGVPEVGTSGNALTDGQLLNMGILGAALLAPVSTPNPAEGTWQPALLTRTVGPGPIFPVTVRGVPIVAWAADPLVGRQISRQQVFRG